MPRRRASRRYKRFFFTFFAAFSVALFVGAGFVAYGHFTAREATAEIISVDRVRSPLYTVRFVTEDGRACEAVLASSESGLRAVGSRVVVRYDRSCLNVWRPGDQSWILMPIVSMILLGVGATGAYLAWFRTDPDGTIRWRYPIRYGGRP